MRQRNLVFTRREPVRDPEAYRRAVAILGAGLRRGVLRQSRLAAEGKEPETEPGNP